MYHKLHLHAPVLWYDKNTLSEESTSLSNLLGTNITQHIDRITLHQQNYISTVKPVKIWDKNKNRLFNWIGKRWLKSLVDQIKYIAKQTHPDLAYSACSLSTKINHTKVTDIVEANKDIHHAQKQNVDIINDTGPITKPSLLQLIDASHRNDPSGGSKGAFIFFLQGHYHKMSPLLWCSHKLKHVVKSAVFAETMACIEREEYAMLISKN